MKKNPQRMCVACRERKNKSELIRVVLLPDGRVEIDPGGKMAGRGAYVCKNNECLEAACKAHRIEKSLKGKAGDEIADQLKAALDLNEKEPVSVAEGPRKSSYGKADGPVSQKAVTEDRILSFLGLAVKAGQVVSGADAVLAASGKDRVCLFIASEDAAEGTSRLVSRISEDRKIPLYRFSSKSRLGQQLGKRDRAVVAVTDKNFAEQLIRMLNEYVLTK